MVKRLFCTIAIGFYFVGFALVASPQVNARAQDCDLVSWWNDEAQQYVVTFFDLEEIAQSQGRISLAPVLIEMRRAQRDFENTDRPACADPIMQSLSSAMDATISAYLSFQAEEPDYVVQSSFLDAGYAFVVTFMLLEGYNEVVLHPRIYDYFASSGLVLNYSSDQPFFGIPTPTITSTPRPTRTQRPTTTATPAPELSSSTNPLNPIEDVVIVRVIDPGNITSEGVEIRNNSTVVDLDGWLLMDDDGHVYSFPQSRRLFQGGSLTIFTRIGDDTPIALYQDQSEAIFESGELLVLIDSSGDLQSIYIIP